MDVRISPKKLTGKIAAITSKSDAHRCLICAALCDDTTDVVINDSNRDIEATASCLRALGAEITQNGSIYSVTGIKSVPENALLDCGESGSTLRFMLPLAAATGKEIALVGSGRLPERPLSPLMEEMEQKGCKFSARKLPLTVSNGLNSGKYTLPGNVSSQYITGLLLALPLLDGDSEITLTSKLESAGYVDMTVRTLSLFGIEIETLPNGVGYKIKGGQRFVSPKKITVEGDWSNAAFWLAAGAVSDGIEMSGLDVESAQGDREIVKLLKRFGAKIAVDGTDIAVSSGEMSGITVDVSAIPDAVPILAVLACAAGGETKIVNAARLRIKESDRLKSVTAMITTLGGDITELADGLVINGSGKLNGGVVDSFNDHRIAMAAAIACSICEQEVIITNAQAVEKSYPKFFEHFNMLGGEADVI